MSISTSCMFHKLRTAAILKRCCVLLLVVFGCGSLSYGQDKECKTKLGIPVLFEDFGKGDGVDKLPPNLTTYTYVGGINIFPSDGYYAVTNNMKHLGGAINNGWLQMKDHTSDDTLGRMLIVNANASQSGSFYKKEIKGLCGSATYEFSAWIANILNETSSGACPKPHTAVNVTMEIINTATGAVLGTTSTGPIPSNKGTVEWKKYSFMLQTNVTGAVSVVLKNNGLGGCGNDLAIDDISFAPCGSLSKLTLVPPPCGGGPYSVSVSGVTLPDPWYQWQKSTDNGVTWTNVNGPTQTLTINETQSNTTGASVNILYRVVFATTADNLKDGSACRYVSDPISVTIASTPKADFEFVDVCMGETTVFTNKTTPKVAGINYEWYIDGVKQTAGIDSLGNLHYKFTPPAATHKVKLIASFGGTCPHEITKDITVNEKVTIKVADFALKCFGDSNGVLEAITKTGIPTAYLWKPGGQTTAKIENLKIGSYTVYVTDKLGCKDSATAKVTEPTQLVITNPITTPSNCGKEDGTAEITVSGGTPVYIYKWTPTGGAGPKATDLKADVYTVLVTDANGCTKSEVLKVNNVGDVRVAPGPIVNAKCNKSCDGSATVIVTGTDIDKMTFLWTGATPITDADKLTATGLCAGVYTFTVTDKDGCKDIIKMEVKEPTPVTIEVSPDTLICPNTCIDLRAQAAGGTPAYTYSSLPAGLKNVCPTVSPTVYTIQATDANGCKSPEKKITVTLAAPVKATTLPAKPICVGDSTQLTASGTSGTLPYTFLWKPGNKSGNSIWVKPTSSQVYTVYVTDQCRTIDSAIVSVLVNPLPIVTFKADDTTGCVPLCVNFSTPNTGVLTWDFGDGSDPKGSPTPHCYNVAGTFTVSLHVTDKNGCKNSLVKPGYINVYPFPKAEFTMSAQTVMIMDSRVCFTDQSQDGDKISWDFGDKKTTKDKNTSTDRNPCHTYGDTGNYCVTQTVETRYGCPDVITHCLKVLPDFFIYIPNAFTPNGHGKNETFYPVITGGSEVGYELLIFHRWGDQIFSSKNMHIGWDGTANGGSEIQQQDVYVWKVTCYDLQGKKYQLMGTVTLIK